MQVQTSVNLAHMLLINCADTNMVQQALKNNDLDAKIKKRMTKYLNIVEYFNNDYQEIQQMRCNQTINTGTQLKTANFQNSVNLEEKDKNKIIVKLQMQNTKGIKSQNTAQNTQQNKKITTSRYINSKQQPLNHNKDKKLVDGTPSRVRSRSRSISNSNFSQTKPFHKIQLKSVKKIQKKQQNQNEKQKQNRKVQKKQIKNPNKGQINKRYTISHKNIQKKDRTISNQIGKMDQNSRLTVSRLKQTENRKQRLNTSNIRQVDKLNNRISCKSRYKNQQSINVQLSPRLCKQKCHRCQRCQRHNKNKTNIQIKQEKKSRILPKQMTIDTQINNNSLIYETVQKSNDFLMMLKMMNNQ